MEIEGTLREGAILAVIGMVIVFLVLSATVGLVSLLRRVDERWQRAETQREHDRLGRAPSIDTTTAVLLAAAVATYVGGRARIRSVRRLLPSDAPSSGWSAQGRAVLMGSHSIQRRER